MMLLALCYAVSAEVVVIVHQKSDLLVAKKSDIVKVFTGRGTQLEAIVFKPILQTKGTAHEEFLNNYLYRTNLQLSNAWKKLVFTGKASMPVVVESDVEVISAILKDPKIVGYVDRNSIMENNDIVILELQ